MPSEPTPRLFPANLFAAQNHPPTTGNLALSAVTDPHPDPLLDILHQAFGFSSFRANQEAVCRAAVAGEDVLLVMPTGAGKSLCYQLPAVARGGTALVISPLIALIEDQAAKLNSLGFKTARIHSGLDRSVSRQACVDYLSGALQFLFIAPERLRVPGFPEMLARRKPALVAIDEAHCISQWGHDFRPDYRTLGQYLPALRPAPVLALTATATPAVQRDILTQLHLTQAKKFIHGFRRHNLSIEVVEVPMPMRGDMIASLLKNPTHRPTIIYAPARKKAEELAAHLNTLLKGSCRTAAYHAGLPAEIRESVQQNFQSGSLDCVVATIAFGMGIDKADVRTVIHAALPSTLEGYYQEIGRAGRDGLPSRAILMHSFADQRTHDFFLKRDYPPIDDVRKVYNALSNIAQPLDEVRDSLRGTPKNPGMDEETFAKAIEKLFIHGGAVVDYNNNATRGENQWSAPYTRQSGHRRTQLDLVQKYVDGHQCRMAALVLHFGDIEDGKTRCGLCDFCSPSGSSTFQSVKQYKPASRAEAATLANILEALRNSPGKSLGRLIKDLPGDLARKELDIYLAALAKADLVSVEDAEWIKDGETILFRKASLTAHAEELESPQLDAEIANLQLPSTAAHSSSPKSKAPARSGKVNQIWSVNPIRFHIPICRRTVATVSRRPGARTGPQAVAHPRR